MTTIDINQQRPVINESGISTTTLRNVGDRQKTAQRLLRSTADRSYDGELDIDWDAPIDPHKRWAPEHRISIYGTKLWDSLTEEQRMTLGKHELVSMLSFGLGAEIGLSTMLLRGVLESDDLVDDHSRYALAEVGEECRHSTMFSRLINLTGVEPYPQPIGGMLRFTGFIPAGPAMLAGTLLIEEMLDRMQREAMNDPDLQPHVIQMMRIHTLEEARHITYAREELVRAIRARGKISNAMHRGLFAFQNLLTQMVLSNPQIYRSIGISPWRGLFAALASKNYRDQVTFRCEPLMRYLYEVGMIQGPVTIRLYKLARCLPDDILRELESTRRSTAA